MCVCSHSSRWPVLWLCHSVLPAVCPPSQPAWLQAIIGLAVTLTPEREPSSLTGAHTPTIAPMKWQSALKGEERKKLFMIFWTEILPAGIKWWKAGRERSQTVYYCKARLTFRLESLNYRRKVIQLTTTELKHWLWEHVRQHLANASEPS